VSAELDRLRVQVADARAALDRLLDQRAAALEGAGAMPSRAEVDKASARLEAAEALILTHTRMAVRT
jgi:multidrug efflux pump subunit AcrA (membrane-fusion protein)